MKLKRSQADIHFSKCIRERAEWTCELCGTQYPENAGGLECSHYFSRSHYSTRFNPDNAFSHCTGCHTKIGGSPHDFSRWVEKQLGESRYQILVEQKNNIDLGREVRKMNKNGEASKHFREQLKAMKSQREAGKVGRIEFIGL